MRPKAASLSARRFGGGRSFRRQPGDDFGVRVGLVLVRRLRAELVFLVFGVRVPLVDLLLLCGRRLALRCSTGLLLSRGRRLDTLLRLGFAVRCSVRNALLASAASAFLLRLGLELAEYVLVEVRFLDDSAAFVIVLDGLENVGRESDLGGVG